MKKSLLFAVLGLAVLAGCSRARATAPRADYPAAPVPFTDVHLADSFWAPRLEINRTVTIPHNLQQLEETRRVENFDLAAAALAGAKDGQFCSLYPFDDSDVYKAIEAASYVLAIRPDPGIDKRLDTLIARIASSQEPDGYLYTARTIGGPPPQPWVGKERWAHLYMSHELYNVGHLYEAAAAHYQATGKRSLLEIAIKSADLVAREFGPGKRTNPPGHQEIEIGLVKLYRITGTTKYLDLAKFFIDARGRTEGRLPYERDGRTELLYGEYAQDHVPFADQGEAVGHAVRAGYLYAAAADVAALTGDPGYTGALDRIWSDVVGKKLYVTGGIGAAGAWEGYGPAYRLPNASAYAETCANIATFLWNSRMLRLALDAKYADVMERILYNGVLSGLSLSGDRFFYPNPLASFGQHQRTAWFKCACCPPNVARVLSSVPGYFYAAADDRVYVNLYAQGSAKVKAHGTDVEIRQATEYPWKGDIVVEIAPARPVDFTLNLRIPGWALNRPVPSDLYTYTEAAADAPVLTVNGEDVPLDIQKGYAAVRRTWTAGDRVRLTLPMPVRRVVAHEAVEADRGRVAVERGPLVYCAEGPDNGGRVSNLVLPDTAVLAAEARPDLLNGVVVITGEGQAVSEKGGKAVTTTKPVTLIPYYAWANRGAGEMAVWLARDASRARIAREPGLATKATVAASEKAVNAQRVNDEYDPERSDDGTGYMHWWPKKGAPEWVEYTFASPVTVSEASVYWFDDTGGGGVRVPASWRLLYKSGSDWVPVKSSGEPPVAKARWNTIGFAPVRTTALRLEIQAQKDWSVGVHEWKVK
ncbi:MAG TPA: beta-L-arabinofuranosidase domain-containing protein [Vicinamibacterales bacterium]|nr:beta-L-arabinofuranosidase domain-containing protein [Vicinamibacterales bacterium]